MIAITGFVGTVYVHIDKDWHGDIWTSEIWPTPELVLDELFDNRKEISERLDNHCEDDSDDEYDGDDIPDTDEESHVPITAAYRTMVVKLRDELNPNGIEESYDGFDVSVKPITVHIPYLTETQWNRICGKDKTS
jgi:hypothetical protein